MPKFIVIGVRTQEISVEVEADDPQEAIVEAYDAPRSSIDVWDTTVDYHAVEFVG